MTKGFEEYIKVKNTIQETHLKWENVTAEEWNRLWNEISYQSNNNSEWLGAFVGEVTDVKELAEELTENYPIPLTAGNIDQICV